MKITNKSFFTQPVEDVARALLGKILVYIHNGETKRFRITDVEAYGANDSACHGYRGKTKRNAPMFEDGGILYIYLCYGIYDIVNIVSGKQGSPEGVMIRGVQGIKGPGRVSRALGITRDLNYESLTSSDRVWIEDDGFVPREIKLLKRVGIGYAIKEDQDKLWRFVID